MKQYYFEEKKSNQYVYYPD